MYRRPYFRHRNTRTSCCVCRMPQCTAVFVGHQERIFPGDASRPHSDNVSTRPSADPDAFLLIRVPVYGLCDSGRGFWRKVDHEDKQAGLLSSRIFPAFSFQIENGAVDVVLATRVHDFLWACTKTGHAVVDSLLTRFEVGRKEVRFCGKQFDASGHDILLDVEDNKRNSTFIEIARQKSPGDPVTGRREAVEKCRR